MKQYTPSETSTMTGFSLDTLRYYEKIGLLHDISRTTGGKRVFTEGDLGWLDMLRCLRDTGMPIAQMCRFAQLARGGKATLAERVELLEEHARGVDAQMRLLQRQRDRISSKISWYRSELA